MNERISTLRQQSLDATETISSERALLVTEFYRNKDLSAFSIPEQRAMAFKYILENKSLCYNPGELIVGERGPEPKATPTYPEISLHSVEDLKILDSRPKVSFKVDEQTLKDYQDIIIPFWKGKTQRERIFNEMDENWLTAYTAGVFTEFQEQRAPGHTVCGDKIYKKGMLDIQRDIQSAFKDLDADHDPLVQSKKAELKAMHIAADAIMIYAERYRVFLSSLAKQVTSSPIKQELENLAFICGRVPANAPETFHEALQYYWFVHLAVITELNPWDSFNPGRLDQHLYPFYLNELNAGCLSRDKAEEQLQSFWIKFNNHPSPPKMGVTAKESSTYTDFSLINIGGVKSDGSDASNELSYLILDVVEEMRILQPSSMLQLSRENPDKLIHRALKIVKTGFGQPSIFNTDAIIQELLRQGKDIVDARNGGASGCVETGAFGTESYVLTGYFNLTKVLEITLNNGVDPRSGELLGLKSGTPEELDSFETLMSAYQAQLNYFIDIKIKGNRTIEKLYADYMPVPFLSLLIDDCIQNATDYNAGGARYKTCYIQGVGLGSITDSLSALKYQVYESDNLTLPELMDCLDHDFQGCDEIRHQLLNHTPKWGNDEARADTIAQSVFEMFFQAVDGRDTYNGGKFRINLLPTTSHIYFGSVIGATADGRKAGTPLSEGISPVQGADRKGPTAVLKSAGKLDHIQTGGTLLNQKFSPDFFSSEESIRKLSALVRSYFRMDGHHIQFNVVDVATLRAAQKNPEAYADLIVRVAGYSDYFKDLSPELQEEIIRRTEHES